MLVGASMGFTGYTVSFLYYAVPLQQRQSVSECSPQPLLASLSLIPNDCNYVLPRNPEVACNTVAHLKWQAAALLSK